MIKNRKCFSNLAFLINVAKNTLFLEMNLMLHCIYADRYFDRPVGRVVSEPDDAIEGSWVRIPGPGTALAKKIVYPTCAIALL